MFDSVEKKKITVFLDEKFHFILINFYIAGKSPWILGYDFSTPILSVLERVTLRRENTSQQGDFYFDQAKHFTVLRTGHFECDEFPSKVKNTSWKQGLWFLLKLRQYSELPIDRAGAEKKVILFRSRLIRHCKCIYIYIYLWKYTKVVSDVLLRLKIQSEVNRHKKYQARPEDRVTAESWNVFQIVKKNNILNNRNNINNNNTVM